MYNFFLFGCFKVSEVEWEERRGRESEGKGVTDTVKHLTNHSWDKLGDNGKLDFILFFLIFF